MARSSIKPDTFLVSEEKVLDIPLVDGISLALQELEKRGWNKPNGRIESFHDYDTGGVCIRYFPTRRDLLFKRFSLE